MHLHSRVRYRGFGLTTCLLLTLGSYLHANLPCTATASQIRGTVFNDINYNGNCDPNEEACIAGIVVILTDGTGTALSTTTALDGTYTFDGLTPGTRYRLEFTNLPTYVAPTFDGSDNGTPVQFHTPGNCADLAVSEPDDFCQTNPPVVVSCFAEEDGSSSNAGDPALLTFPYAAEGHDFNGTTKTADYQGETRATISEVGSVYGVARQRQPNRYYVGAFHKRYSAFGPGGPDAIYQFDAANNLIGTLELDALTGTTDVAGADVHDFTLDANGRLYDLGPGDVSFDGVGKRSFGDLEMSADGKTLYVVNLFDRTLYFLDVSSPSPATATLVRSLPLPDATGAGRHRPFALAVQRGRIWVGSVDENGTAAHLHSVSPTGSTFVLEHTVDLTFDRQVTIGDNADGVPDADWNPWTTTAAGTPTNGGAEFHYAQPILTDLAFDGKDLILGFRDRFGDQSGSDKRFTPAATSDTYGTSAGDLLRVCYNAATDDFITETGNTGACPGIAGRPNSGPGGEEYYHWDFYDFNDPWDGASITGGFHYETAQGGLLQLAGQPSVMTTAMDPINDFSGGVLRLDNTTGRREGQGNTETVAIADLTGGYTLFEGGDFGGGLPAGNGTFAKANGLGDLEALCDAPPLQIGNYVWFDADEDGEMDANEPPLGGVHLTLYDAAGNVLATTTTDADGEYQFAGSYLTPETDYLIGVGADGSFDGGVLTHGGTPYFLTDGVATGANADAINNDAVPAMGAQPGAADRMPLIALRTGTYGRSDFSYDVGFATCDVRLTSVVSDCQNNGTRANTADDFFTLTLTAASDNPLATLVQVVDGANPDGTGGTVLATGSYGQPLTVGADQIFAANGVATYVLTLRDVDYPGCFATTTVGPVNACSTCPAESCGRVTILENTRD